MRYHRRTGLLCSTAVIFALGTMQGAFAQEDNEATAASSTTQDEDVIIVTGSNIAGTSDSGTIAVTILDAEQLDTYGQVSAGELLENLPQAGSFEINDSADGPNDARGDVATVNLRGLGSGSTLILLNGRRIAPHAVFQDVSTQGAGAIPRSITNVQAFPTNAIDRVEVLRDGASALYGSDAVAGVINTILDADFDRTRFAIRGSTIEGTNNEELKIDGATGFEFNEGQTRLVVTGSYFTRDGLFSSELDGQFNNVDKRGFLESIGSPFAGSTDFRNTSTRSPFGQFRVGELLANGVFDPIDVGGLTAGDGDFHVQPCSFAGTRVELGTFDPLVGCVGLDDGNLNTDLRFDFNSFQPLDSLGNGQQITLDARSQLGRQLISDAERINFYSTVEHDLDNGNEFFGEILYYNSSTQSQRAAQPTDDGLAFILVPRTNFYNPVGAITSPNRVAGINAPDEGLDVLISRWRPTELGPRIFEVDATTYRALGGFRGEKNGWDWETALHHSESNVEDTSSNRISKTLLQQELAKDTPDAINPFGGPNANTQEQLDRIRISVTNEGKTALTSLDFRASNASLWQNKFGDIGAAFGAEVRHEYYEEDRDPRLDGTIIFDSGGAGVSDTSDVVGVSPTADSDANRDVLAAFGEVLVPVYRSEDAVWINEINLQVAGRAEYFSDIDEFVAKPKVSLSYFPVEWLNFRAGFSQGFRAPNLVQLNRGDISRLNQGIEDAARADVTGDPLDTGETFRPTIRRSNPDLKPETSETFVIGMTAEIPFMENATFSIDYYEIDTEDLIGTLGPEFILNLDNISLQQGGGGDPRVVRLPITAEDQALFDAFNAANPNDQRVPVGQARVVNDSYINLDKLETAGIDIAFRAGFDFAKWGDLNVFFEANKLEEFNLFRSDESGFVNVLDQIERNGNPEWRATANITYRNGPFGAGTSVRYIGAFEDTSVDNVDVDNDGEIDFFPVESWTRVNSYVDYRFDNLGADQTRVRFGVNNMFDEAPPIADESRGYFSQFHSPRGREYYVQLRASW